MNHKTTYYSKLHPTHYTKKVYVNKGFLCFIKNCSRNLQIYTVFL